MNSLDERGFSGAEIFFVIIIVLLLILAGGFVYVLSEMGPEDKPAYIIEDVYFEEKNGSLNARIFITNLGKSGSSGDLEWEVTDGSRLIEKGNTTFQIEGRATNKISLSLEELEEDEIDDSELEIEVFNENESMDTYSTDIKG